MQRLRNLVALLRSPRSEAGSALGHTVVVVSGLPRSGTSMMMRMLEAGGLPVLVDHVRGPDADNPRGYYELERVKRLPHGDVEWLRAACGKAVKIVAPLLPCLPDTYTYRVLLMRRIMSEILASQRKMLLRQGAETRDLEESALAELFERHLQRVEAWLMAQPHVTYLDVHYNHLLRDPGPHVRRIQQFLGYPLDTDAMLTVIEPSLYRQRREELDQP